MLKWSDNEKVPHELMPRNAPDSSPRYVTMLFNDETHTYEEVHTHEFFFAYSCLKHIGTVDA